MSLYLIIDGNVIGRFANAAKSQDAVDLIKPAADADNVVVENTQQVYEQLTEPQIRQAMASLEVYPGTPEAIKACLDEKFNNRYRAKKTGAQALWNALETKVFPVTQYDTVNDPSPEAIAEVQAQVEAAQNTKAPRKAAGGGGAKGHIRALFPEVGVSRTYQEVHAEPFSVAAISTGISDLRNAKYAAGELMRVERVKSEDGKTTVGYKRTA